RVHEAEVEFRIEMALVSRPANPPRGFLIAAVHASPGRVALAKLKLRCRVSRFSLASQPSHVSILLRRSGPGGPTRRRPAGLGLDRCRREKARAPRLRRGPEDRGEQQHPGGAHSANDRTQHETSATNRWQSSTAEWPIRIARSPAEAGQR